jgi:hypothetical protein
MDGYTCTRKISQDNCLKMIFIIKADNFRKYYLSKVFSFLAQQPSCGQGRLVQIFNITHARTHTVKLLSPSDQLVAEATTYTAHKHGVETPMR